MPARSSVQVAALVIPGPLLEMEVIARKVEVEGQPAIGVDLPCLRSPS
jgi:hypothetical protein